MLEINVYAIIATMIAAIYCIDKGTRDAQPARREGIPELGVIDRSMRLVSMKGSQDGIWASDRQNVDWCLYLINFESFIETYRSAVVCSASE